MAGTLQEISRRRAFDNHDVVNPRSRCIDQRHGGTGGNDATDAGRGDAGRREQFPELGVELLLAAVLLQVAQPVGEHTQEGGDDAGEQNERQQDHQPARPRGSYSGRLLLGHSRFLQRALSHLRLKRRCLTLFWRRRHLDHHRWRRRPRNNVESTARATSSARARTKPTGRPRTHRTVSVRLGSRTKPILTPLALAAAALALAAAASLASVAGEPTTACTNKPLPPNALGPYAAEPLESEEPDPPPEVPDAEVKGGTWPFCAATSAAAATV